MCYSFVFTNFNTVRVWGLLVNMRRGIKRWQINATLTSPPKKWVLHRNWGGQLTRNLRRFCLTSLRRVQPASLFSCILTRFIPPQPRCSPGRGMLPALGHSRKWHKTRVVPLKQKERVMLDRKNKYWLWYPRRHKGVRRGEKEKERREQNREEKIEEELRRQASPGLSPLSPHVQVVLLAHCRSHGSHCE